MRVPSTPSTVSIDQAWSDLRRHLEWTRNEPTVVMVAAQTRAQTQDLKERVALWCRRAHEPWSEPEAEQTLLSWLSRHLPVPGVLFLDLWDERVRRRVLHALNEMRIRLARPGGGCVIVCGPIALLSDAAREAADLWSIRSLTCVIGSGSGEMMDLPQRREEDDGSGSLGADDGSRYRSTWSITVPPDQRTPELAATIRETDRARRLLPAEPVKAREILDALPENPSPLASTLRGLTGAEIGGLLDDVVTVEMKLKMVLGNLAQLPPSFRRQTADTALMIAMTFGAVDAAGAAAQELVRFARGLEEVLGTPEARRGLSVAWNNLGRAAQARGDWATAAAAYQESLAIRKELERSLGTPESRRDLSVAWSNVGDVARARGDWDAAEDAYRESLVLARGLEEELGTPESRRDLSIALSNVGRAARARGDWDAAEDAYLKSLELALGLEEELGTPEARRGLSVAWNNLGRVAWARGDWDAAQDAYLESLVLARGLEEVLGTPESRRDLSVALNNVGRVAEARGDWHAAQDVYLESLVLARGLEEVLGTPESRRDLSISLDNVGQVAEVRGHWDAAEKAYLESLEIRRELENLLGTPQAQQDVSTSQENLRRLSQKRADLGDL